MYAAQQMQQNVAMAGEKAIVGANKLDKQPSDFELLHHRVVQLAERLEKFHETFYDRTSPFHDDVTPQCNRAPADEASYRSPATRDTGAAVERAHQTLTRIYETLDSIVL